MKPINSVLLSLLLLALSPDPTNAGDRSGELVFDIDGDVLQKGQVYYVLPAAKPRTFGGLTLQTGRNLSCPFEIVQTLNRRSNGTPLKFSPSDPSEYVIRTDADLNIGFSDFPSLIVCPEANVWMVDFRSRRSDSAPVFVTTGGVEGNPGPQTLSNWFKIQKHEDAYRIQYCPSSSLCGNSACDVPNACENIGVVVENGRRRLALTNKQPFKVVFDRMKRCLQSVATV